METSSEPADELLLLGMDGAATPRIYPLLGSVWSLDWSLDGRRLAIVVSYDDDRPGPMHGLWTLDIDRQDMRAVAGIAPSISEAVSTANGFAYRLSPIARAARRRCHPIAARCSPAIPKAAGCANPPSV